EAACLTSVVTPSYLPERPVGAPLIPRPAPGGPNAPGTLLAEIRFAEFVEFATRRGAVSSGHHNQNYVLPLTEPEARLLGREVGTSVTVRIRRAEALPVVIRTWDNEEEILGAVKGVLPHVPQCLVQGEGSAIHGYVEGVRLSSVCGNGKPVDTLLIRALVGLLARMTQVRRSALPPLPSVWPRNDTDSQGFLRALAYLADQQIRQPNWRMFGGLF